ncbi:MAG: hypothetical protein JRI68_33190, partial [Deltaproteobacteria bacterium]|nr:hypothetical protein [Deltaproteobacteria bacterium]
MVHGSLGLDRIYVTWDARLWLYGVGLPSLFDDQGRDQAALAYHAPEQRTGARPVARADVYGAALIIWSLLTGRLPEAGAPRENLARYCPELPPELARGLDNALQKSPLRRTLSCRALEHIVTTTAGVQDECPELLWNMDLFRGIIEEQAEGQSDGPPGFTAPPPVISLPPADEDDGRAALVPGPGPAASSTDDSTVQRLSDLFEALPAGADSVPAPDGDEEDGWLIEVVRKSTAGQEPGRGESAGKKDKSAAGKGEDRAAVRPASPPKPPPSDNGEPEKGADGPAEVAEPLPPVAAPAGDAAAKRAPPKRPVVPAAVSAAETVPAAESTPPPGVQAGSTPPPLPSSSPPDESSPPPLSQPSPPPMPTGSSMDSNEPPRPAGATTAAGEPGGLLPSAPELEPTPARDSGAEVERPWWLYPMVLVAVAAGVVLAIITFKPGLFGLGSDASPSAPTGPLTDSRPGSSAAKSPPPDRSQQSPLAPTASGVAAPSATVSAALALVDAAAGELPPVVDELGGDGSKLLSFEGYLIVRSVAQVDVVVQGKARGPTNRKLKTHCRQKNVRLRDPSSGSWLTPGEPVRIKCMGTTTVVINP